MALKTNGKNVQNREEETPKIKFETKSHYDRFIKSLKSQLKTYILVELEENNIEIDSEEASNLEILLMDVFMKYTVEFMRENFLVEGQPIPSTIEKRSNTKTGVNGKTDAQPPITKRCDGSLNERVVRQQYVLYDAAVVNTKKRKDLPEHIMKKVENALQSLRQDLDDESENVAKIEKDRLSTIEEDPRSRWEVINADLPKIKRLQDDYTETNKNISTLITTLPKLIEETAQTIDLYKGLSELCLTGPST